MSTIHFHTAVCSAQPLCTKSKRKQGLQLVSTARKWQHEGSSGMRQLYHVLHERLRQIGGKEEELIRKVWDTVRTGNHYYKEEWGAVREITAIDVDSNDVRYKELQLGQHRQIPYPLSPRPHT